MKITPELYFKAAEVIMKEKASFKDPSNKYPLQVYMSCAAIIAVQSKNYAEFLNLRMDTNPAAVLYERYMKPKDVSSCFWASSIPPEDVKDFRILHLCFMAEMIRNGYITKKEIKEIESCNQ
jgi:hypothetical protein